MKVSFVVVLSAAALLSGISAEAQVDSGGFDARGICRRPEGWVVHPGPGGRYTGPRNYRIFTGGIAGDGWNDRERDNRRYRSQNRSDNNFDAGTSRLVAGPEIGLGAQLIHIRV